MISLIVLLVLNQHSNHEEPIISCPNFAHGNGNFKSYGNASKNRKMAWIWHWIWWASQFHTLFWWVIRNLLSRSEKNSTAIWFSNRMYLDIFYLFCSTWILLEYEFNVHLSFTLCFGEILWKKLFSDRKILKNSIAI